MVTPVQSLADLKTLVARVVVGIADKQCSIRQGEIVSSLAEKYLRITELEGLQRELESLRKQVTDNGAAN